MNPSDSTISTIQPTRYVDHPVRRRAWRAGRRNLAWGVAFLFAALSVLGIALFMGGARALLPALAALVSFTTLWVLARLKIFAQRNGVFFSLAIIALLGAVIALLEQAWVNIIPRLELRAAQPTVSTAKRADPGAAASDAPDLIAFFKIEPPDPSLPRVRAVRDLVTVIAGKTYSIRSGDTFLLAEEKGGEVSFSAGEFLARVPAESMAMLAPLAAKTAPAEPSPGDTRSAAEKTADAQATQRAQAEAMRRFPGLGKAGSPENKAFLDAVNDLKARKSEMLGEPEWPLQLAETLANRLGWQAAGVIEEEPAPIGAVEEPAIAPGTKVLSDPADSLPAEPAVTDPPAILTEKMPEDPEIPPPPKVPAE